MITNKKGITLSVALMLINDNYDYDSRPNAMSVTSLLKPIQALVLAVTHKEALKKKDIDISDLVASSTGSAVHDSVESTWLDKKAVRSGLDKLGHKNIDIIVNPTKEEIKEKPKSIVVWVEQRGEIKIADKIITGKFDFVGAGYLEDIKNTIEFIVKKTIEEVPLFESIMSSTSTDTKKLYEVREKCPKIFDYVFQGSAYKLIHKDKITHNKMAIQFIIKDFKKYNVGKEGFPDKNPFRMDFQLFSEKAVKDFIQNTISVVDKYVADKKSHPPKCLDKDLWQDPTVYKVYKDSNAKRALPKGTFTTYGEAEAFKQSRPNQDAEVRGIKSTPKRCSYCAVVSVCPQAKDMIRDGILKL